MENKLKKFVMDFKQGRGDYGLLPVEFKKPHIPFDVKRSYFLISGSDCETGQHAHYDEEEVFLVLTGEAELISLDSDGVEYTIPLKSGEAVYVPNKVWHGFKSIKEGTVVTAFSSTHHKPDRSDYIEDKEKFINL